MKPNHIRMKQGDMVQHIDFPRLRGVVQEVTATRRNAVPRKVKVLWFPLSQRHKADYVPWTIQHTILESQEDIAVMKLVVISQAGQTEKGS